MRVLENGCAYWSLGSIVEVGVCTADHDPNYYRARCLTGGTFPTIQVLDDKYPEPLQSCAINTPVFICRELAESAEVEEEQINGAQEEHGMFVIIGCSSGNSRVGRKESDEIVQEGFDSVEDARDWIDRNKCDGCGQLKTDSANGCQSRHLGAPEDFSF